MFQLKNISKKYGENTALNNVTLSIQNGMNFIIGASGSGKSTLLKIMSGFDNDYSGKVSIFGKDIGELSKKEILPLMKFSICMEILCWIYHCMMISLSAQILRKNFIKV